MKSLLAREKRFEVQATQLQALFIKWLNEVQLNVKQCRRDLN